jgi:rod shape-determining protein MreC
MRNIFLFIRRYFNFFAFLALQFVALSFLVRYNKYHRASFLGVANEITGNINSQYDKLDDYFHQGEENKRVHQMNDSLLHLLRSNFVVRDTSMQLVTDSTRFDSTTGYRRYIWRAAKVVSNSANQEKNYIQLNRGAKHGIRDNMAVINSDLSAVGIIVGVSENFSQAMSLLHIQSNVNSSLKKSGEFGTLYWDARDPRYVQLRGIPKSAKVVKGDTVVTSNYSYSFPPGIMVGTVERIIDDKATNFYTLDIKTAANFLSLQQVFIVENLQRQEQVDLDNETRKKIDQAKN